VIALRPGQADDAEACAAILLGWTQETPWFTTWRRPHEYLPFVAGMIAANTATVAEVRGETAGFMSLEADHIACLYLAPGYRGRGLGVQFLDVARKRNPSGLSLWTFQANSGARRFYEREGFIVEMLTDGARNEEGIPDVMYVWEGVRS
jgi:putative acetyltransferase